MSKKKVVRKNKQMSKVDPHVPDSRGVKFVGGSVGLMTGKEFHFPTPFFWVWNHNNAGLKQLEGYVGEHDENPKKVIAVLARNVAYVTGPTYTRPLWPDVAAKDIQASQARS